MNLSKWEPQTWVAVFALLISVSSLLVNWRWNTRQRSREDQMRYVEAAGQALEIAYQEICPDKKGEPSRDRLRWLSCARNILYAQGFTPLIKDSAIKRLLVAKEEYWRVRFYELLSDGELNQPSYFSRRLGNGSLGIHTQSAYVIFHFVQNGSHPDPMVKYDDLTSEEMFNELTPVPTRGLRSKLELEMRLERSQKYAADSSS